MNNDLTYTPNPAGTDTHTFSIQSGSFFGDMVSSCSIAELHALSQSDDWQDRVRAEIVRERSTITLPDGFPCIYEQEDSPNKSAHKYPAPTAWVVSPDIDMLRELLPLYQELWDAYTSQWGPASRRVMAAGRLNGLSPRGVCRPGTTPEQVIGSTMLTHTGMYRTAPKHLQEMHPLREQWTASRA